MRLLWLADVLRGAGLTVVEEPGWKTRGDESYGPVKGVIIHETRGSATSTDAGEIGVLINGRVGLSGPIAQLYLSRSGVWHVIASGTCHHVRTGWGGPFIGLGNDSLLGIEPAHAESEDWAKKPAQYASYVTGVAAILRHTGWPPPVGHKEHQPGDKPDPEFSMAAFRTAVAAEMEYDMGTYETSAIHYTDNRVRALVEGLDKVVGTAAAPEGAGQDVWQVRQLKALVADVAELKGRPPVQAAPADPAALKAVLLDPEVLAALAKAVNDDAAARLAE